MFQEKIWCVHCTNYRLEAQFLHGSGFLQPAIVSEAAFTSSNSAVPQGTVTLTQGCVVFSEIITFAASSGQLKLLCYIWMGRLSTAKAASCNASARVGWA